MNNPKFVDFRAVKREVSMLQILEHYGLMSRMHRNGDSITGPCPIHEGKNETAFRVSISKNCWNCFSKCGSGGNVLDFVAKKENVSILKAANLLAEWFNLRIESSHNEDTSPGKEKAQSTVSQKCESKRSESKAVEVDEGKIENKPLEFVLKNLQGNHPYLTERGLSFETIQTFGLGFCSKGLQKDRIAIPIHNAVGELVAYAGRWPGNTNKDKYQLPRGFRKSLELFNLHRALAEPQERPLVIVEGFFDAMKLHQCGCKKVVALMGSTMSGAQEALLQKHCSCHSQIILMLDEDEAGQKAREEIAVRVAKFASVKIHVFQKPGAQPEHLTYDECQQLLGVVN